MMLQEEPIADCVTSGGRRIKASIVSHLFPNVLEPLKGVFVAEFAKSLAKVADVEVVAPVSYFPFLRKNGEIPAKTFVENTPVHHPRYLGLPGSLFQHRWRPYYSATRNYPRQDFKPDLVHCHWLYPDAYAACRWAKPHGIKTVVTIHGHAAFGIGIGSVPSTHYTPALKMVDHIIAVSSELRDILTDEFHIPAGKISIVHNGIDPKVFHPIPQEQARQQLGLPLKGQIILAVARLAPEKRLNLLIEAFALSGADSTKLYIAGDGPLKEELAAHIVQKGLQDRVILLGGLKHADLCRWYQACDIVCLSSAHEGCPVIVHEALACGKPVVSTRVGAVPDIVTDARLGLLSPPDQLEPLAANIREALNKTWDSEFIAQCGRQHTWDNVAKRTLEVAYLPLLS